MNKPLKIGMAAAVALSTAAPAAYAQYYPQQYREDLREYREEQADYQSQRASYEQARREYDRRRDDYERARAAYDARWGYGAYARRYGPAPVWDERNWDGAYAVAPSPRYDGYAVAPSAGYYGRNTAYGAPVNVDCNRREDRNATAGAVLGAIAGAVLGSNVAARNARTEGAVLGAIVGGGVGLGIGKSTARCDDRGYYYSYNETVPYREPTNWRRGSRYDYSYYNRMRCRLAPAPVDFDRDGREEEFRYVRVCPDESGRYRFVDDAGRFRYWG
ncbi:glycine zipper 2TM domain-containing protein [Phenylobacterium sp.]|jgi:hypothetical protein|uniref:glycine zipper 2TM domain-containing protein n=1 Tax=Phenylobacterium sp. TaxID=1871053 RepID=UPI002E343EB7|nr:glycine zipper 2TM domain-containing protein [Phenylobacterium sp.]HEX2561468.1 glycine zipper 2TM domain-containing protein [Phenylobacterium sp.]